MAETIITEELAAAAILGGAVLGGGGGGSMAKGRANAKEALVSGKLRLVDADGVPPEAILVTGSAVGAHAAKEAQALPKDYVRVVELLSEKWLPETGRFYPQRMRRQFHHQRLGSRRSDGATPRGRAL